MLELKRIQTNSKDEYFRQVFLQMVAFMRMTQLTIQSLQQTEYMVEHRDLKPLKRFSQEVFVKLNWFFSTVKKISDEETAEELEKMMDFDSDKLNDLATISSMILGCEEDITPITDLVASNQRRRDAFWSCWRASRETLSGDVVPNPDKFIEWYKEYFKS